MPMSQELGAVLERVSTLELRVHDLEARLAAAAIALLGLPIPASPVVGGEITNGGPNRPEGAATMQTQVSSAAAMATTSARSGSDTPSTLSAATGTAAEVRTRKKRPRHSPVPKDTTAEPVPATTVPVADLADAEAPTTAVLPPLTDLWPWPVAPGSAIDRLDVRGRSALTGYGAGFPKL